jgi:PAS domain S-box-containing protein
MSDKRPERTTGTPPSITAFDRHLLKFFASQRFMSISPGWCYLLAIIIMAIATSLRHALIPWIGIVTPYNIAFIATVIVTVLLGLGPGMIAVLFGDIAVEVFIMGSRPENLNETTISRFAVSVAISVFIVWLFHAIRTALIKSARSESRLAAMASATFEGIVESEAGRIVDCNEQLARILGYSISELRGREISSFIPPEELDRVMANIRENRESAIEHEMFRKDGSRIIVETHGRPVSPGAPTRHTSIRDITERKKIELELHRSREEYQHLVEGSSSVILLADKDLNITFMNQFGLRFFGYSAAELIGRNAIGTIIPLKDEAGRDIAAMAEDLLQHPDHYATNAYQNMRNDGSLIWMSWANKAILDDKGNVTEILAVGNDLTRLKQAEEALHESEAKFRSIFAYMLNGFAYCRMLYDENGRPDDFIYLDVNDNFEKLTGLKDVIGKRVTQIIPQIKELNPELFEIYGRVAKTGVPERFEIDFKPLSLYLSVSVYSPENGYFAAVFEDISERKQNEKNIFRQTRVREAINRIFETALVSNEEELGRKCLSIVEDLTESKFSFVSELGEEGLMHDIAISDPGWELCSRYDKTGHRRLPGNFTLHGVYGRVILDGRSMFTNSPSSHPDSIGVPEGHPKLTAFLGVPFIQQGKTIGMVAVANRNGGYTLEQQQDLEAIVPAILQTLLRKRVEKKLHESEERFRVIASSTPDHLLVQDKDLRYAFVLNPQLGLTERDMIGKTDYDILSSEDARKLTAVKREVMGTGRPVHLEVPLVSRDNQKEFFEGSYVPRFNSQGQVDGLIGYFRNITERKSMEEELRKSHDELEMHVQERTAELNYTVAKLEKLNKELQEFAHVASHDLQEPLRKIQTFCDIAMRQSINVGDNPTREYLERIINSATRMRRLLHDLLQLSRIDGKAEDYKRVDLTKIAHEAADLFNEELQKRDGRIEIKEMPVIDADETQILRLFQNLIGNAIKFQERKSPVVEIFARQDDKVCEISVRDNGIGFDPEHTERIFKPFQRLHGRKEYEGTGMGLAICRKIAERHFGSIRAVSEPGKGSTFIVRLPLTR